MYSEETPARVGPKQGECYWARKSLWNRLDGEADWLWNSGQAIPKDDFTATDLRIADGYIALFAVDGPRTAVTQT
jgi:hypothetical protein